ncbi:hypothetical protein ACYZT3_25480 [Pseudomonas sp. MDT1-16]
MFKEILDALGKIGSRSLTSVFIALAISTFAENGGPIADPFSKISLVLPFLVFFSSLLLVCWVDLIHRFNSRLADHDQASWGPLLGGSLLAFCLTVTFWYVSNVPEPLSLKLFGMPNFIRLFALYLFAIETINIGRSSRQRQRAAKLE